MFIMEKQVKIVSLFSGIGGFELGIRNSKLNGKVVFSSEIDKYATMSYLSNFEENNLQGDITKISEKDIPNHDFLVAGFPCQAFSIAGRQKGFNDIRGTMYLVVPLCEIDKSGLTCPIILFAINARLMSILPLNTKYKKFLIF